MNVLFPATIRAFLQTSVLAAFLNGAAFASMSDSSPLPAGDQASPEIDAYNAGCKLLHKKKWHEAQQKFEEALDSKEAFAEAHNNLAFVLRMQGENNYQESLLHYDRAIALAPKMPEPYMYRGSLYFFMGKKDLAEADYNTLKTLKPSLARELREVLDTGKEELDEFYGVSKQK
jgi:tetratricopeptide (TPR) repeat protein